MSVTSVEYLFFLPIVFVVYWTGPSYRIFQNTVLLTASYLFFGSWHWHLLLLIIGGTWLDFFLGRAIHRDNYSPIKRRLYLVVSLLFSIGGLCFFKYAGFFASAANDALRMVGIHHSLPILSLLLPLGISYWTLQRVGYMLDIYWRRQKPADSLLDFSLFVCFFGQLAAGPISRGSELLPQLQRARRLDPQWITSGSLAFLIGYVLKAFVSEVLGENLVSKAFLSPDTYAPLYLWLGVFAFGGQVFADFAGYSLMAIGTARLFAIELPQNFNAPFISKSLPEFWRRWHITLNRWLFNYIFTPLITSKGWFRGKIALGLLIVFTASGLWHGAAWTYITWGVMQGVGMMTQHYWDTLYRSMCRQRRTLVEIRKSLPYKLLAWLLTITFFVLTLIPFRAPDIQTAFTYFHGLLTLQGTQNLDVSPLALSAFTFIAAMHVVELPVFNAIKPFYFRIPPVIRGLGYGMTVSVLILIVPFSSGTFIYQQF